MCRNKLNHKRPVNLQTFRNQRDHCNYKSVESEGKPLMIITAAAKFPLVVLMKA
jgi:hypothetical protein